MTCPAPLPPDEAERLAALRRYAILDSAPEESFDRITRLAARQFRVPMAMISLVDENRQWFKSACGLDATETDRDVAFCPYALAGREVFMVPDATQDPRFADNPLVTGDPKVRFYAGAPLINPNGHALGTLCVVDVEPRAPLSAEEQALLTDLAAVVADQIEIGYAVGDVQSEVESRVQAQSDLAFTEHVLELFFEHAPVALAMLDRDFRYVTASRRWLEIFEIADGSVAGRAHGELVPHSPAAWQSDFERCLAGETVEVDEDELPRRDGWAHWVRRQLRPWRDRSGAIGGVIVFVEIIDERKQASDALERSQRLLSAILDNTADGIVACDADGQILLFNKACRRIHGVDCEPDYPDKWVGKYNLYEADGETPLTLERIPLFRALSGEVLEGQEIVIAPKGDTARRVVAKGTSLHDVGGQKLGAVVSLTDVTKERAAEQARREADMRYRAIFNHTFQLCGTLEPDGTLIEANDPALRLAGTTREKLYGRPFWDCPWWQVGQRTQDELRAAIEQAATGKFVRYEVEVQGDGGARMPIDFSLTPVADADGTVTMLIAEGRDISERKQTERQLVHAQKMELIGQLTGGMAHDFNNLLAVVLGNLQLLERSVDGDDRARARLDAAAKAVERGAELTRRLLAFSRRQTLETEAVDPNPLIEGMSDLLQRTLGETVSLECRLAPEPPAVRTDPCQLESAILNLAVNARDAMPDGGMLTIESSVVHLDQDYAARQSDVVAGHYVAVAVTDTGSGLAPELLEKVFEPFFTTKDVGKGSGLGLSMVYGFMKQSGGHIRVYSEVGKGTTIRLYLPVDDRDQRPDDQAAPDAVENLNGHETILIVEDQQEVREVAVALLEDLGYSVLQAINGPQGLELMKSEEKIDLLLTDIVMPGGLNGTELADIARTLRPELPIVFTTGFAEAAVLREGDVKTAKNLVTKPFRRSDLAGKIRFALDQRDMTIAVAAARPLSEPEGRAP